MNSPIAYQHVWIVYATILSLWLGISTAIFLILGGWMLFFPLMLLYYLLRLATLIPLWGYVLQKPYIDRGLWIVLLVLEVIGVFFFLRYSIARPSLSSVFRYTASEFAFLPAYYAIFKYTLRSPRIWALDP